MTITVNDSKGRPLSGVRVVALEQAVAGPLASRHLADLGADVVKVERPGGDFARRYDSVVKGQSAYFVWLNRGKRSAVLDLKNEDDREVLDRLLERSDVLIHNLGPGVIERLGLGWEAVHRRWRRLISCGISGYGTSGSYRNRKAFDLLLQGESGIASVTGSAQAPAKVGVSIADIAAGMYALSSILAVLHERTVTGEGRFIDISMLESLGEWMMAPVYHQLYGGNPLPRTGMRHNMIVPYGPFEGGDGGTVIIAVQNEGQWERLCGEVLGRPDLIRDARFITNELRVQNRAVLEPIIEAVFKSMDKATLVGALQRGDVPYGDLNGVAEFVAHPQLDDRRRWLDVATEHGSVRALADPFNIGNVPARSGRVASLGEHTSEIRREVGRPGVVAP